jgi:hypothetical protein
MLRANNLALTDVFVLSESLDFVNPKAILDIIEAGVVDFG